METSKPVLKNINTIPIILKSMVVDAFTFMLFLKKICCILQSSVYLSWKLWWGNINFGLTIPTFMIADLHDIRYDTILGLNYLDLVSSAWLQYKFHSENLLPVSEWMIQKLKLVLSIILCSIINLKEMVPAIFKMYTNTIYIFSNQCVNRL